ncbi:sulfurtransferase TusA family protein [Salinarimonas ramus]|uniref:UPF0033 domain-containing protein n=1 Tax=Salinarimonas ramus TaxID=690164 RepID=A0A917V2E8_9HYPH|nr:sulfurtransferase TusA family protein [Salinarimonas ramus]GGK22025.1 hypothetical protein GCM10011322_05850 [Salinarimonas ramus]
MTETELDLRGLKCPLPALKTRKALSRAEAGALLVVTCTDPMAAIDIPHLLNQTGDELLDREARAGENGAQLLVFRIRKAASASTASTKAGA